MPGVLMPADTATSFPEERGGWEVERLGQREDVVEAHVALPSLDAAHVVPMESGKRSKSFLRQTTANSQLPKAPPECGPVITDGISWPDHERTVRTAKCLVYTLSV